MNLIDNELESKRIMIEDYLNKAYCEGARKNLYDAYQEAIKLMDKMRDIEINTDVLNMECPF